MSAAVQTSIIHVVREGDRVVTSARQPRVPQLLQLGTPMTELVSFLRVDPSPFLLLTVAFVAARKHCGADSAYLQPLPEVWMEERVSFKCSKGFNLPCE